MKTYIVGGAVRDKLLGLPVSDRDHVVVGATVDDMIAAGYRPVGRDFPVFLHPLTHEEYALARTERKVAAGYAGFVFHADPTVTLEDDLARRDLTINAIAEDEATHALIDPFGGQRDLARRVLRHVGPAFVEDPVRILRLARFAARFDDFSIADETLALMREMVAQKEVDALVPERVWREMARGLMESRPSRMIAVLRDAQALARVLPEVDALFEGDAGRETLEALDRAASLEVVLEGRFAVLVHAVGTDRLRALCTRLAVPRPARDLALLVARNHAVLTASTQASDTGQCAEGLVLAMERCDAFRRASRFDDVIAAVAATIADPDRAASFGDTLTRAARAAQAVDASAIARAESYDPSRIVSRLHASRVASVRAALASGWKG